MEDVPVFPDLPAITVERTLAIIKPDAVDRSEAILEEIKSLGFTILQVRGAIESIIYGRAMLLSQLWRLTRFNNNMCMVLS